MKHDLIVVGGGPAGLMAAKTAAEDGLKVLLIERKRNITEVNRACAQIFYTHKLTAVGESEVGKPHRDGYIDPVSLESDGVKARFHFPVPAFSLEYEGPLIPYLNWVYISPSGYPINGYKWNERPWGFYYHKETFLTGLLASVEMAGAEVRAETIGLGAENTRDGVKVRVRGKAREETLEARAAIAADGLSSKIVDSLGLNESRQVRSASGAAGARFMQYIVEGVETGFPDSSWLSWAIPSLNPSGSLMIGISADSRHTVAAFSMGALSPGTVLNEFMSHARYAHMFRHARVVKKEGFGLGRLLAPIREPVAGNVVVTGDAGAPAETWIQGAVACGYQAVKAIEKELNGQKGYPQYVAWWQQAFAFNTPDYGKIAYYSLPRICSDEEIDYIHSLFQDKTGIPVMMMSKNMELIKEGRPELYEKLRKTGIG